MHPRILHISLRAPPTAPKGVSSPPLGARMSSEPTTNQDPWIQLANSTGHEYAFPPWKGHREKPHSSPASSTYCRVLRRQVASLMLMPGRTNAGILPRGRVTPEHPFPPLLYEEKSQATLPEQALHAQLKVATPHRRWSWRPPKWWSTILKSRWVYSRGGGLTRLAIKPPTYPQDIRQSPTYLQSRLTVAPPR